MKWFFLLLFSSQVLSASYEEDHREEALDQMIQPPMILSEQIPLTMDEENQRWLEERSHQRIMDNVDLFQSRLFPWKLTLLLIAIALGWFLYHLILQFQISKKQEESEKQSLLDAKKQLLEALGWNWGGFTENLENGSTVSRLSLQFQKLDFLIRDYLRQKSHIDTLCLTKEEIQRVDPAAFEMNKESYQYLVSILQLIEQVEYARHVPSNTEYQNLTASLKKIVE